MKTHPWLRRILDILNGKPRTSPAKKSTPKAPAEPYVYITRNGKKFHYDAECSALRNAWIHNEVIKMDLSKARAAGRTACDKCCYSYLHD